MRRPFRAHGFALGRHIAVGAQLALLGEHMNREQLLARGLNLGVLNRLRVVLGNWLIRRGKARWAILYVLPTAPEEEF